MAHHKVMNGKPNYLLPILMEHLDIYQLPRDLQTYLRTHTYIDAREYDQETLRKRIRFSMPDEPLTKLRQKQNQDLHAGDQDGIEMEPMDAMEVCFQNSNR